MNLILGDCLAEMAKLPSASVDAVVTDPPYGLEFMGKTWDRLWNEGGDTFSEGKGWGRRPAGNKPRYVVNRKCASCGLWARDKNPCRCESPQWQEPQQPKGETHQSRRMQSWHEAWARQAFRLLKPGGHLLAFGGTRTYHRLACAIEDAGFEIRDCLVWGYASGFPKSYNVGQSIEKLQTIGKARRPDRDLGGRTRDRWSGDSEGTLISDTGGQIPVTTDDAKRWDGWGTALKPAWEPIVMARKPLRGTVAANVLKYGTGALNIEACRIPSSSQDSEPSLVSTSAGNAELRSTRTEPEHWWGSSATDSVETPVEGSAMSADTSKPDIGCSDGTTAGESAPYGSTERSGKRLTARSHPATSSITGMATDTTTPSITSHASAEPSMPPSTRPPALDENSATSNSELGRSDALLAASGRWPPNLLLSSPIFDGGVDGVVGGGETGAMPGTYRHAEGDWQPTSYAGTPPGAMHNGFGDSGTYSRFFLIPKEARSGREPNNYGAPHVTVERSTSHVAEGREDGFGEKFTRSTPRANVHPTVKPLELMRHLVRLVTPPRGTVLDPFLGSGTTAIACEMEGFAWIGIEKEPEYVEIAKARLNGVQRGLGLDVGAPTRKRSLGPDKGGGTRCSFFPEPCQGHPGHGRFGPTVHARAQAAP